MRFAIPGTSVIAVRQPGSTREGLPLVKLRDLLRLPPARREHAETCVVVATDAGAVGFVADRLLDVEGAEMRQIAPMLHRSTMFSGSAVLNDGDVVMVLDPDAVAGAAGVGRCAEPPIPPPALADHPDGQAQRDRPRPERARGAGRSRVLLVEEGGPTQQSMSPASVGRATRFRPWWAAP